jgi:hypothetical protein
MLSISLDILKQFDAVLEKKAVLFSIRADYKKWLRYYLDFRAKYSLPNSRSEQVRLFVEKLSEKNQKNYYCLHACVPSRTLKKMRSPLDF